MLNSKKLQLWYLYKYWSCCCQHKLTMMFWDIAWDWASCCLQSLTIIVLLFFNLILKPLKQILTCNLSWFSCRVCVKVSKFTTNSHPITSWSDIAAPQTSTPHSRVESTDSPNFSLSPCLPLYCTLECERWGVTVIDTHLQPHLFPPQRCKPRQFKWEETCNRNFDSIANTVPFL